MRGIIARNRCSIFYFLHYRRKTRVRRPSGRCLSDVCLLDRIRVLERTFTLTLDSLQ